MKSTTTAATATDEYSTEDLAYTIGLIAGEGSFFVGYSEDSRYSHGLCISPRMSVGLGEKDRKQLVEQQRLYSLGNVSQTVKGHQWVISSRVECQDLIGMIDSYIERNPDSTFLSAAKYDAYQNWCSALELLRPGQELTSDQVIELAELREKINPLSATNAISLHEVKEIVRSAENK